MRGKKIYKSRTNAKLDGVCGGIAEYLGVDATLVRIIWLLFAFSGMGILFYIICAFIIPREPADYTGFDQNRNQ